MMDDGSYFDDDGEWVTNVRDDEQDETDDQVRWLAARGAKLHVHSASSLVIFVSIHHGDYVLSRNQLCVAGSELVFARRNLFPPFAREFRVFHRVRG